MKLNIVIYTTLVIATVLPCRADQFALKFTAASNGSTVIVHDNGVGDLESTEEHIISFSGAIGKFNINLTSGGSGLISDWVLDLSSFNLAKAADTLTITLSQTGLTESFKGFAMMWGGVLTGPAGSTVTASAWVDTTNALFGKETVVGSLGPYPTGAFSGIDVGPTDLLSNYALTQEVTVALKGTGSYSGNLTLMHTPEPATWVLLGSFLWIAGFALRRRNKSIRASEGH
jgi:hypothetical protein